MERGFVWTQGDTTRYLIPGPGFLLSDGFLDTHCFRLQAGEPGLIGLAFEPVRGRRLPDISGVMWIDVRTGHLRSMEFRYVRVAQFHGPVLVPESFEWHSLGWRWATPRLAGAASRAATTPGGRVDFEQLSNGAWIIRRWSLRVPRTLRYAERGQVHLAISHIHEEGGEVVDVQPRR